MKYSYSNLVRLVLLTIIIIVVINVICIRSRIVGDNSVPVFGKYQEGAQSGSGSALSCSNTSESQQKIDNILGPSSYSSCMDIQRLLNAINANNVSNLSYILEQAKSFQITKINDITHIFNTMATKFKNSTPLIGYMILIFRVVGMQNVKDFNDFVSTVDKYKLQTAKNNVFPSGGVEDKSLLVQLYYINANCMIFKDDMLKTSIEYELLQNADDYYEILNIARQIGFQYSYSTWTNESTFYQLLNYVKNYVPIAPEFNSGSTMLRKMKSLQQILTSMQSNWSAYLSYVSQIKQLAGDQTDIPGSVKAFADYLNDKNCKSDMATNQDASGLYHILNIPSDNQLAQMLYLMNFINTQSNKQYFNYDSNSPIITDLKKYWTTKKNERYTIYQIVQQAELGSTASKYVSNYSVDGFENMANTTFLDSVSNFWTKIKYYLVGREGATQLQPSDDQVLRNFGITDAKGLSDLTNSMNQYTRGQNLSKTNTDWDNMIKLVNALQDAGVTNITWPQYRELMSKFCVGTNTAQTWINVLESMSKLNLRTYPKAESFIKTLVQFNVFYTSNFNDFIAIMKTFQLEKLNNNFDNFNLFVADMMKLGYNYTSNASQVNTIVKYLMMLEMNITQYTKGSLAQNIIMGLFSYSSKTSYYPNALKDVLTYEQLNLTNIQFDGKVAAPFILREIAQLMNSIIQRGEDPYISPNISVIISFLSPEEFQLIADHAQMPTDIPSFMNSIQIGIQTYNNSLDQATLGIPETILKLNVARMGIQMFPHAMFQYITMEIWSKPTSLSDPNSSYRVAINPDGSAKKAHHRPK